VVFVLGSFYSFPPFFRPFFEISFSTTSSFSGDLVFFEADFRGYSGDSVPGEG